MRLFRRLSSISTRPLSMILLLMLSPLSPGTCTSFTPLRRLALLYFYLNSGVVFFARVVEPNFGWFDSVESVFINFEEFFKVIDVC